MIYEKPLEKVCSDIPSCTPNSGKQKHGTRYKIPINIFMAAYTGAETIKEIADELGCSLHYVRRRIKKMNLPVLVKHGGKRDGGGRPAGSKNKNTAIEYIQMLDQLKKDQRANSIEVGIGRSTLSAKDIAAYGGSVFDANGRCKIPGVVASYYELKSGKVKINGSWKMGLPRQLKTV